MKHAWKICMLLGILIVCLLLPVSSIHEGFKSKKRRRRERRRRQQQERKRRQDEQERKKRQDSIRSRLRREYKNELNTMDCNAIQQEINRHAPTPTYFKSIYAKREYETKGCKSTAAQTANTMSNIQSQLNEVSEKLDNTVVMQIPPGGGK